MHEFIQMIVSVFRRAVPFALMGLALGTVLLIPLNGISKRKGTRLPRGQAAAILLLTCYLGGLAALTFLDREGWMRTDIQFRPLLAFREAWNAASLQKWLNPLLNIAMFLPLGLLLPLAVKPFRRWYWTLPAGAGASLIIEALQYLLGSGQADVDDLICNTLGAMLGWCLCMLAVCLLKKERRRAGAYAILPILSVLALFGVWLAYALQPYGNLEYAPIYPADVSGVEWVRECALSEESGSSGVYWSEPFTRERADAFAVEFLGRQGTEISFDDPDVSYYDNLAVYSDHHTYSLWVNYTDRSYRYADYRVDSSVRYRDTGGTITEGALRTALEALGIDVPGAAQFSAEDETRGVYAFRVECAVENDTLTTGELTCRVTEDGTLYEVMNSLSVSTLRGEAAVISPAEAYRRLYAGRFSWRDVPAFNSRKPAQARVTGCMLEYMADSKGFWQPVYTFTIMDDAEAGTADTGWSTFVPALGGP